MTKPYSAACDRNRDPILEELRARWMDRRRVLEIGSGTGQHAAYFAAALPHLVWQTSDVAENIPGIRAWLEGAALPNTPAPLLLDVNASWPLPDREYDAVFSANTLHIMAWSEVERMFAHLSQRPAPGLKVAIYGPFNYGGRFTSDSNAAFDRSLKARGAHMGIRDFEAVDALAASAGLTLLEDVSMPANNRLLLWQSAH